VDFESTASTDSATRAQEQKNSKIAIDYENVHRIFKEELIFRGSFTSLNDAPKTTKPHNRRDIRVQPCDEDICGMIKKEDASNFFEFQVFDVAPDGVGIICDQSLAPDQRVELVFSLPFVLQLSGQVIWVTNDPDGLEKRVGVQITPLHSKKLQALYDYVLNQT
jgi:hypothetical protein